MKTIGRCYCGSLKYEISGQAEAAFQCHCRECQYITGGNPNIVIFLGSCVGGICLWWWCDGGGFMLLIVMLCG